MRARALVACASIGGAIAFGAWWWSSSGHDGSRDARARRMLDEFPVVERPAPSPSRTAAATEPAAPFQPVDAERRRDLDISISVEGPLDAVVRKAGPVQVRVVDHDTHADLTDVRVVPWESVWRATESEESSGREPSGVIDHANSPITLAPKPSASGPLERIVFCAPGYVRAWADIDFREPNGPTVELAAAAALVVEIRGVLPTMPPTPVVKRRTDSWPHEVVVQDEHARDPRLRLRSRKGPDGAFGNDLAQRPAQLGETLFDELLPGDLVAAVEVGDSYRSPIVLASAPVHVVARETARVVLDVEPLVAPTLVPLAGTLRVPLGWKIGQLGLELAPRRVAGTVDTDWRTLEGSEMEAVRGRGDTYRFDFGGVLPGKYALTIRGASCTRNVEVPPTGAPDVVLEVPEHTTLHVRVVSTTDGSPVKMSWLDWTPADGDGQTGSVSPILLLYDEASRSYGSGVPVGRGKLESFGADAWVLDETVEAELFAGEQELVARVRPIAGAIVELTSDGRAVRMYEDFAEAIAVAPVGGGGRCLWKKLRDKVPTFAVDPPGRYLVTLPAIAGYEPVAPFEVDLAAGPFRKTPVELRSHQ